MALGCLRARRRPKGRHLWGQRRHPRPCYLYPLERPPVRRSRAANHYKAHLFPAGDFSTVERLLGPVNDV